MTCAVGAEPAIIAEIGRVRGCAAEQLTIPICYEGYFRAKVLYQN